VKGFGKKLGFLYEEVV